MDELEIVITPRTIERVILGTIIIVLAVLLVIKWDGGSSVESDKISANVVAEQDADLEAAVPVVAEVEDVEACENGVKDLGETDVDCGGSCGACAEYQSCNLDNDCSTGLYCFQHVKCLRASCDDGLKNQDETNVDCGGTCGGYFWNSDDKCHDRKEPSGELKVTVDADVGRSPNSGSAIIEEVSLNLVNELGKDLSLTANIYARDEDGYAIFEDRADVEIALETLTINMKDGATFKKTLDFTNHTRSILAGIKSTEPFQIYVELKDSGKKTIIAEATWVNE
jgi:hypothetical protein